MNALIIEDEKAALRNLKALLAETAPEITVVGELDSIFDSLAWFQASPMPDVVFLDIHLADGSAFEIFEHTTITCPIIFTTAYDEYALRAFRVNSIDYLLKPINRPDLQRALDKLRRFALPSSEATGQMPDFRKVFQELKRAESFQTHFLIPMKGDKLLPISVDSILFFYITDGQVKAVDTDFREYFFPQTLDELAESLDPQRFFRANRQFLISKKSIRDIDLWFNGRLSVNLKAPTAEKVLVSKARVAEFKEWLVG